MHVRIRIEFLERILIIVMVIVMVMIMIMIEGEWFSASELYDHMWTNLIN